MSRGTLKTSTILVGVNGKTHVFRSVREMPEALRQRLKETTGGPRSATMVIADRRGRAELERAMQGLSRTPPANAVRNARTPLSQTESLARRRRMKAALTASIFALLLVSAILVALLDL